MNIKVVTLLGLIFTKLQKVLLLHVYFNIIQQCAYMYIVTSSLVGGGVCILVVHFLLLLMDYYEITYTFD